MKKILAMAMLVALMFNMGGYLLLFQYFIHESDQYANEQISKGYYRPNELVEIKIPVRMPYVQEQRRYENITGQIQLKGNCYNYVALKMTRDTMYVQCIPNYVKTKLVNDNVITAKQVSDTPLAKKNHLPVVKKTGLDDDYNYTVIFYNLMVHASSTTSQLVYLAQKLPSIYLSSPAKPPKARA